MAKEIKENNEAVENREFKIIDVSEHTTKDGRKFSAYKTLAKNGKKMDVRFTRTCTNVPTEPCVIVVRSDMCNVDTTRQYPILWVKDVVEIKDFERTSNVADYFD